MGYGGMHRGHHFHHHHGVRRNRPRPVRHHHHYHYGYRRRPRTRIRFGFGTRRHYYGVHHVHHTRAYYVGAETAQEAPQQPPYTVLFETQSQFQKIKIVEFTNQVVTTNTAANPVTLVASGPATTVVTGTNTTAANSAVLSSNAPRSARSDSKEPLVNGGINGMNDAPPSYAPPPYNPNADNSVQVEGTQVQGQQPGSVGVGAVTTTGAVGTTTEQKTNGQQVQTLVLQPVQQVQVQTQALTRCRGLVLDNEIQFSTLDEQHYHNALVHSAMDILLQWQRNTMLRVLIIGGGDCCCIRELVKYDANVITEVTMIEIDQMVVDTCSKWFPTMTAGLTDQRVRVIYNDANVWVKQQIDNRMMYNYDLIICDLTEDGTISQPLIDTSFWNNLSQLLKTNVSSGQPEGIIIRNGYHKPSIFVNNNENQLILQNQYYISTNLPTFGGQYCFTILSHAPVYGNLTDFNNVDPFIRDKNGGQNINTKIAMATPQELEYSYNYYYYNPIPEEPCYQRYGGWIILSIIVLIILIIVFA